MVILALSVHLTTLFSWASLTEQLTSTSCTYFGLKLTTTLLESVEGRRTVVWDRAGITLWTLGSAVQSDTYLQPDMLQTALDGPVLITDGLTLGVPMKFSIKYDTVKSGWSIVFIKGSQVTTFKKKIFLTLKINFVLANSAEPDEMTHYVAFIWVVTVCQSTCLGVSSTLK